jgi:hypothetical protein
MRALMVANGCSTVSPRHGRQRRAQPGTRLGVAHEALTPRLGGKPVGAIGGDQFLQQAARLRRVDSALDATERGGGTLHHHGVLSDRSAEGAHGERHVLRSVREEPSEQRPAILRLAPLGRFRPAGATVTAAIAVQEARAGRRGNSSASRLTAGALRVLRLDPVR